MTVYLIWEFDQIQISKWPIAAINVFKEVADIYLQSSRFTAITSFEESQLLWNEIWRTLNPDIELDTINRTSDKFYRLTFKTEADYLAFLLKYGSQDVRKN